MPRGDASSDALNSTSSSIVNNNNNNHTTNTNNNFVTLIPIDYNTSRVTSKSLESLDFLLDPLIQSL